MRHDPLRPGVIKRNANADDGIGVVPADHGGDDVALLSPQPDPFLGGRAADEVDTGGRATSTASTAAKMPRSPRERTFQRTLRAGNSFSEPWRRGSADRPAVSSFSETRSMLRCWASVRTIRAVNASTTGVSRSAGSVGDK